VRTARPGGSGRLDTTVSLAPGWHDLVVEATDTEGLVGRASVGLWVDDPATLPAPAIVLEPAAPHTGDALLGGLVDELPRGAVVVWSWDRDGWPTGWTGAEVPAGEVREGETWTLRAYLTTGEAWSAESAVSVLVGNASPDPGEVRIAPDPATVADALTCVHGPVADAEADPFSVAYAWTVDGAPLDEVGAVLPAGAARRGQVVGCAVVLDDGASGVHAATPLTVSNAPPSVGMAVVSPGSATESSTLACSATDLGDADGDAVTVTYRWLVSDQQIAVGPTVTGADFDRGDAVRCEVTPRDPYDTGVATLSAPVSIANTPPGAPEVAFATTELYPGDLASCVVTRPAVDIDGDRVSYTWSWTVDDAPVGEDTSALDTTGLLPGARLGCAAAGFDAVSTGPAGAASLVLGG
jgi:hypothetical protein